MERNLRPKTDKDFGAPPPGYVAGIGRGATGFASGVSRDRPTRTEPEKETDLTESNYDAFAGYSGSLFDGAQGDAEDVEADQIYDLVESRMESRRKKAREERMVKEASLARQQRPNMQQQFADYKKQLASISEEDWMKIPEAQERLKAKRVTKESLLTAPDRILAGPQSEGGLNEVGLAKKAVLELSLDKTENSSSDGVLDASNYLAQMDGSGSNTFTGDIAEIKKARLLFKSITRSDPTNATGWLAAARLEEVVGNLPEAKGVLARGITNCPNSEDLWLNAIRLETDITKAKSIVANGIRQNPKSALLWTEAARLEDKDANKIRVFQKSLEVNKNSPQLWKALINLVSASGNEDQVLTLLGRAVQCCPQTEDLWLTYAKLSKFGEAQKILNDARKAIPTSVGIWTAAAELAAAMGVANLDPILTKAIGSLETNGVSLTKAEWLVEATKIATSSVAESLTRITIKTAIESGIAMGKNPKAIKHEIFNDFETMRGNEDIAKTILETAARETELRYRKGVWVRWLQFELECFPKNQVADIFESAVSACPQAEILWLMFAKYMYSTRRDCERAKEVLNRAMTNVPESEEIYMAAVKVVEKTDRKQARQILVTGREMCGDSVRIWLKSAQIERWDKEVNKCLSLIEGALEFLRPLNCWKLFLVATHVCLENNLIELAEKWIDRGIETCPGKAPIWAVAADVAVHCGNLNKARSILERGRIRLPNDELLWWKGYMIEIMSSASSSTSSSARVFMSRALQACPNSGILWSYAIEHEPVVTRHPKCLDALKKCENDPLVVIAVARFFWLEKKQFDKARKWFQNAARMDKYYGQVWSDYIAFELSQGDENCFNFQSVFAEIRDLEIDPALVNKGIEWNVFRKRVDNWDRDVVSMIVEYSKERFRGIWDTMIGPRIAAEIGQ